MSKATDIITQLEPIRQRMGMAVELGGGEAKAAGRCARALLQAQSNTLTALSKRLSGPTSEMQRASPT